MNDIPQDPFDTHLVEIARTFPYPPTPDLAGQVARRLAPGVWPRGVAVRRQRLAWAALVVVVLLAALLGVPPVRAQILEFIQVGIVRIFTGGGEITPAPERSTPTPVPIATGESLILTPGITRTAPPGAEAEPPEPTPIASLLELDGAVSLEQAMAELDFPILRPTYPEGVGAPAALFLQDLGGQVLVQVWMDPGQPDQVLFSLHTLGPGNFAVEKVQPVLLEETKVNGITAYWTTGPYLLRLRDGSLDIRRLVRGHVLIWPAGELTYRLETSLPLAEAVRMAESLRPLPEEPPLPTPNARHP